jgi:hypothetical protein
MLDVIHPLVLEELTINKKYKVSTSTSKQRELYLIALHPFFFV